MKIRVIDTVLGFSVNSQPNILVDSNETAK